MHGCLVKLYTSYTCAYIYICIFSSHSVLGHKIGHPKPRCFMLPLKNAMFGGIPSQRQPISNSGPGDIRHLHLVPCLQESNLAQTVPPASLLTPLHGRPHDRRIKVIGLDGSVQVKQNLQAKKKQKKAQSFQQKDWSSIQRNVF